MPAKNSGYRAGVAQTSQPYTKWEADRDEVEVDYKEMGERPVARRRLAWWQSGKGVVTRVLVAVVLFCLGLIIGYVIRRVAARAPVCGPPAVPTSAYSRAVSERLLSNIDADSIKNNLRAYSKEPHLTGTAPNEKVKQRLIEDLQMYNIPVTLASYKVLLSYHNWGLENTISLISDNGSVVFQTAYHGPSIGQPNAASYPFLSEPYNAYAPNGTVEGDLVYANFGEESDFLALQEQGVSCKDKIVIMRYGQVYRGSKVSRAEKWEAKGVILFSDPAQVVGSDNGDVFPESWWLPGWASQRGSILPDLAGDPLSPGLPSKDGMYRLSIEEATLPKIPVQPIGYRDAQDIMKFMTGPLDESFLGGLRDNVTYRMGPGFDTPRENYRVRVDVNNEMETRPITDVFGVIKGAEEPDRFVIIGCHYDAWTFGSVDPNSGTAVLMEVAKAFGNLVETGWRPRRTIMFAHWDGEEQGLIGSYEWVEDHARELADRTVIYINLDSAIKGNARLLVSSTPLLHALVLNVTRSISIAGDDTTTVYEQWKRYFPDDDLPQFKLIGSGSDHAPFLFTLGVPVLWPQYISIDETTLQPHQFPTYHTAIDNLNYMERFIDKDYNAAVTMARTMAELVLQLSCQEKLPLEVRELAHMLEEEFNGLLSSLVMNTEVLGIDKLQWAISNFSLAAGSFHNSFLKVNTSELLAVRQYNDALVRCMQCFIHHDGLPNRTYLKNLLFAPSALDSYSAATFSGIRDSYHQMRSAEASDRLIYTRKVEKQVSLAILAAECATHTLFFPFSSNTL